MHAFVSDLDGTLLNADHSVPREYDRLYDLLSAHSVPFIVASARPFGNIRKLFEGHPTPEGIVACDGAIVARLVNGVVEKYAEQSLSAVHATAAVSALRCVHLTPILFLTRPDDYVVATASRDPALSDALNMSDPTRPIALLNDGGIDGLLAHSQVRAVSALSDPERILEALEQVAKAMGEADDVRVYSYGETRFGGGTFAWLDVVSTATRKEDAIEVILLAHGLKGCELVACGNGENDIGLLKRASLALCPANSVEAVRRTCGDVAPHVEGGAFVSWVYQRLKKTLGDP